MKRKYFYCYSRPLKEFLSQNGLKYIFKTIHDKTKKMYWVYESCIEIDRLLNEWRIRKN